MEVLARIYRVVSRACAPPERRKHSGAGAKRLTERWWRGLDSNQRTLARADLQSAAFNHSATSPGVGRRATWRRLMCLSTRSADGSAGRSGRSMLDHRPDGLRVERVKGIEPSS